MPCAVALHVALGVAMTGVAHLPPVADIPNTALREMRSLQELDHENVIHLVEVFPQSSSLVLVFECMHCDLAEVRTRGGKR